MPIPSTSIRYIEHIFKGTVAAGGSNTRDNQIVFHWRRTTTVNALNKANIDTAIEAAIRPSICAALNLRYTHNSNWIRFIDDAADAYYTSTVSRLGLVTGDSMPLHNAAYLRCKTGLRGRSFNGSKHLFPISESATTTGTDDLFNAGMLTLLAAIGTAIMAGFTDSDGNVWVPCVLSKTLSQLKTNPTNVVAYDMTAVTVNKRVGVMRHRRVKSVY